MRFKFLTCIAAALLLGTTFAIPAVLAAPRKSSVQQNTDAKPQATALPTYPESAEGLRNLLQDWFAAIKAGNSTRSSQFLETFAIPNHQEWFAKTFGAEEGARLEARYTDLQAEPLDKLTERAAEVVKGGKFSLEVAVFDKSIDKDLPLHRAISAAMVQATLIYRASYRKGPKDMWPHFLGDFVYADGGFRYLEMQVMEALTSAPALRVAFGGSVQGARLTHRVEPVYPQDAKIKSTVVLHVIIATNGTMKEMRVVSGHPLLFQAALDAVKQWRYEPTLLNGEPVEVDTQIELNFSPPK